MKIYRYMGPIFSFNLIYLVCVLLPIVYMFLVDFYSAYWFNHSLEVYRFAIITAIVSVFSFYLSFVLGVSFGSVLFARYKSNNMNSVSLLRSDKFKTYIVISGLFFSVFCWYTFFDSGYTKLSSFGKDYGMLEYRTMGMDSGRITTALLQIARRLVLPIVIIYLFLLPNSFSYWRKSYLAVFSISLIIGLASTLDRAPFMMLLFMLAYLLYCSQRNLKKIAIWAPILLILLVVLGGYLSFVQHNIQGFTFADVIQTGTVFLLNRVMLAPSFVSVELSYGLFDFGAEKLWLSYSRLLSLFTGQYIDYTSEGALYVGPVGAVADIWRNMGIIGVVGIGFLLGIYFKYIDYLVKNMDKYSQIVLSFTSITLAFYFVFGTFFSQGVFLQMIVIALLARGIVINERLSPVKKGNHANTTN